MKIKKEDEEKLTLAIQGVIGILIIGLSIKNSVKTQSNQMRKTMAKNAKQMGKLHRLEYRLQKRALTESYSKKMGKK